MKTLLLPVVALLAPAPLAAQHAGQVAPSSPEVSPILEDPHKGHEMSPPQGKGSSAGSGTGRDMDEPVGSDHGHAGHDMQVSDAASLAMEKSSAGGSDDVGSAAPPPVPRDHWADRSYSTAEMDAARAIARAEHGGGRYSQVIFNLAEHQFRQGRDGFRSDGEGWFGGDIDRLTIKTEGEGSFGGSVTSAEVQALWSRAVDAYWNLQGGVRLDVQPGPTRAYATLAVEGLAPYWFDVEGGLFLSDRGDLLARVEAYYDQRLTQRLILQPRVEVNLAAQDVPSNEIGSGLVDAELGLRLRYEIRREFAPYVGLSWERKVGATARLARAAGHDVSESALVAGMNRPGFAGGHGL